VMLAADLLRAVIVLGFVAVRSPDQIWLLYGLAFLEATVSTFFTPARTALVPAIVPARGLLAANGLSQASRVIASTLGAALACVLFGLAGGAWPAFIVDSLTFVVSFLLVLQLRAPRSATSPIGRAEPAEGGPTGIRASLAEGFHTIAASPVLVGSLVSLAVLMLGLGAVNVLFIPLLVDQLHVATSWIGLVDLAQTSSMILSALLIARVAGRLKPTTIVTICLAGIALMVILVAGASALWQVLLLLFLVGWLVTPLNAAASTIIQSSTPPAGLGRVGAALNAVTSAASIASMAAAGLLAAVLGVQAVLFIAGLVTGGSAIVAWTLFRRIPPVTAELTRSAGYTGGPHWDPE
jgi:MFS transporter, DHA3 family, macrolide efflux protein